MKEFINSSLRVKYVKGDINFFTKGCTYPVEYFITFVGRRTYIKVIDDEGTPYGLDDAVFRKHFRWTTHKSIKDFVRAVLKLFK
ncbi:hypothetical protein Stuart_21 [Providencia phage vB_PstP_PS3]|uniref:Uncharacterized protein n=1 Tax=Providencia phage vB_PstP_PS3 TaxID=2848038 RepID=A0A411AWD1_9CAUD|nr:hypothetical protein HOV05_gp21 [Providencia phage vB_PstP_PS3]QAX92417.1 hypothetical protein Stuart_21 [Providencia phage vB_PstP_PS3]